MRGAGILAYGGAVQLLELPAPEISDPQQLLITVHGAGVGNWEDIVRTGGWDVGDVPPMALGVEAAEWSVPSGRRSPGSASAIRS